MNIHRLFPTLLGLNSDPNHDDSIVKRCLQLEKTKKSGGTDWVSKDTFNTLGSHDITNDKEFESINAFVISSMVEFCEAISVDSSKIVPAEGWLNVYRKGDYQEYHNHNPCLLSAIYYIKTPKEGSKLFIKNPFDDMLAPDYTERNAYNTSREVFQPEDGMLVIFRGHLQHCVERHTDDEPRISLAYNFSTGLDNISLTSV
jgi:uncharacterized protein (TIGR02466 family)